MLHFKLVHIYISTTYLYKYIKKIRVCRRLKNNYPFEGKMDIAALGHQNIYIRCVATLENKDGEPRFSDSFLPTHANQTLITQNTAVLLVSVVDNKKYWHQIILKN